MTKEYKDFEEFYLLAVNYAGKYGDIENFRNDFSRDVLHSYIIFKSLNKNALMLLNTKNADVKLSLDNFVKNMIHHKEITFGDYARIQTIIKNPAFISKANNGSDIILFEENNRYFMLVIKTTKNKEENFIKSFRLLGKKEFEMYKKNNLTGWT